MGKNNYKNKFEISIEAAATITISYDFSQPTSIESMIRERLKDLTGGVIFEENDFEVNWVTVEKNNSQFQPYGRSKILETDLVIELTISKFVDYYSNEEAPDNYRKALIEFDEFNNTELYDFIDDADDVIHTEVIA